MAGEPLPAGLKDTVISGHRLHTHLARVSHRVSAAERGGASVEMAMFYGQAFGAIYGLLERRSEPGTAPARVLLEAERGIAAFNTWMGSDTPFERPEQLAKMAWHWEQIIGLVLN